MNNRKKKVRRYYKNFKKSNFALLNKILRILSWLLPGLVIKRWMFTSAIGFLTTLLGLVIWTNLRPLKASLVVILVLCYVFLFLLILNYLIIP